MKEELDRGRGSAQQKENESKQRLYYPNCQSSVASFLVLPSSPVSQQSMAYIYQRAILVVNKQETSSGQCCSIVYLGVCTFSISHSYLHFSFSFSNLSGCNCV